MSDPIVTTTASGAGFSVEISCPETGARFIQPFSPFAPGKQPLTAEEVPVFVAQTLQRIADYKLAVAAALIAEMTAPVEAPAPAVE